MPLTDEERARLLSEDVASLTDVQLWKEIRWVASILDRLEDGDAAWYVGVARLKRLLEEDSGKPIAHGDFRVALSYGGPQRARPVPERAETGVMQFGDDWPGVFIRGDNAADMALEIGRILDDKRPIRARDLLDFNQKVTLEWLRELCDGSRQYASAPQKMKPFNAAKERTP